MIDKNIITDGLAKDISIKFVIYFKYTLITTYNNISWHWAVFFLYKETCYLQNGDFLECGDISIKFVIYFKYTLITTYNISWHWA